MSRVKEVKEEKQEKELAIEDLPGVGAATAEKLRSAGYDTMIAIAVVSPGELVEIAGVTGAILAIPLFLVLQVVLKNLLKK